MVDVTASTDRIEIRADLGDDDAAKWLFFRARVFHVVERDAGLISQGGFGGGVKGSEISSYSIGGNKGGKSLASYLNALRDVSRAFSASVLAVLRMGRRSQIVPSVIQTVVVPVVYLGRLFVGFHLPDYTCRNVSLGIKGDLTTQAPLRLDNVPSLFIRAHNIPSDVFKWTLEVRRWAGSPKQRAGQSVIIEALKKICAWRQWLWFHGIGHNTPMSSAQGNS